jgi:hypothetical protein
MMKTESVTAAWMVGEGAIFGNRLAPQMKPQFTQRCDLLANVILVQCRRSS